MTAFLILASPAILLTLALAIVTLRQFHLEFRYGWPIAAFASLAALGILLYAGLKLPIGALDNYLVLDRVSWPFAVSLSGLVCAILLTSVVRLHPLSWRAWAATLVFGALGILAVMAGNPLALLAGWGIMDLLEITILMIQVPSTVSREKVVASFATRVAGTFLLIWAILESSALGVDLTYAEIPPKVAIFLLLSAGLRLGILPLHVPFIQEPPLRRGQGAILRLAPAAASLALVTRMGVAAEAVPYAGLLLVLLGLTGLYSAWSWATAEDELSGRPFWILTTASLALASAILGLPAACQAWGIACILPGGLLFLTSSWRRGLVILLALGLVSLSGLPFTPTWNGTFLFALAGPAGKLETGSFPGSIFILAFPAVHALLLAGYARYLLKKEVSPPETERWVWLVYPLGLILLLAADFLLGWWMRPGTTGLPVFLWWGGGFAVILAGLIWFIGRRYSLLPVTLVNRLKESLSLEWIYRIFWKGFHRIGQALGWITFVLEGEAGILWTLALLALLFTLLRQGS